MTFGKTEQTFDIKEQLANYETRSVYDVDESGLF